MIYRVKMKMTLWGYADIEAEDAEHAADLSNDLDTYKFVETNSTWHPDEVTVLPAWMESFSEINGDDDGEI